MLFRFSFPNSSGKVYSLVDATFGLGFTLGPVLGSFLYVAGGFVTPFIVTGCLLLVSCHVTRDSVTLISSQFSGVLSVITCKQLTDHAEAQISDTSLGAMIPILKSPEAAVSLLSAATASLTVGFVESTLEMHLETFSLSVTTIGLCFLTMSVAFSAVTFIAGYWSDRVLYPGKMMIGIINLTISPLLVTRSHHHHWSVPPAHHLPLDWPRPLPPSLPLTRAHPALPGDPGGGLSCLYCLHLQLVSARHPQHPWLLQDSHHQRRGLRPLDIRVCIWQFSGTYFIRHFV